MRLRAALGSVCALAVALAAAGCASSGDMGKAFVTPAKYEPYKCPDLKRAYEPLITRERELGGASERADQGGGGFVHTVVHGAELVSLREELRQIRDVAQTQNCDLTIAANQKPSGR